MAGFDDPVFETFKAFVEAFVPTEHWSAAEDLRLAIMLALTTAVADGYERGFAAGAADDDGSRC